MRRKLSILMVVVMVFTLALGSMGSFADSHQTVYEVKSGDTLAKIAANYEGVSYEDIAEANDIENPNLILVGQQLVIPTESMDTMEEDSKEPLPYDKVMILHTNDTHARVEAGDYAGMGFAAIGTKVKEYREKYDNVLVLDAGDAFHGQVIAQLNEGESIAKVFNTIGYDALTAGNHDFNYGQDRLVELNGITDFPIFAGNVYKDNGESLLPGSQIIYKNGLKIGIFGLSTPETTYKTHPKNVEGLNFMDPAPVAEMYVDELEDKTDMIIALTHLGMDEATKDEWTSNYLAENVDGIDVIIDGHSHTNLPEGMMVNDTLIASTGEYDKNLGIVEVHVQDNKVINKVASQFTKEDAADLEKDVDVLNAVADVQAENEEITSVVVAESDQELNGERENVRTGQTNLGNLITKAMIEATNADVALTNGGGIRASIGEGEVTRGDIITVLPFGNYVIKIEITGAELKEAMEHGLSEYPALEGLFPHIAGMTVKFDSSQPVGERVVEMTVGGEPLDEDKVYSLATNDFLAAGGDGYTMLGDNETLTEYGGLDEILTEWMQENGTEGAIVDDRLEDVSADETTLLNQAQ